MRIVVVAGVHLDRAWPELGSLFGNALRQWSREALAHVVDEARRREAASIVVLGGLVSRPTVVPETLEYAAAVLGSFPGPVLVAPGADDWIGGGGPYETGLWPANVHIWNAASFEPSRALPAIWGSAWTSPRLLAVRAPHAEPGEEPRTLVRAGLSEADLGELSGNDYVLSAPDLVTAPGRPGGTFLVVETAQHKAVESVEISGRPGSPVDLDVTSMASQHEFNSALSTVDNGGGPVALRLSGRLSPGILLPNIGGPDTGPHLVVDLSGLTFDMEVPDRADRTTRAEFLRAMALARGDDLERHQTTALGLVALGSASKGA